MLCLNIGDIAIIIVKNVDYRCIMHNINKSEVINLLENSVLEDRGPIKKNIVLIFSLLKIVLFYFFCFSIYKMVDREYDMDIYKSVKINVGTEMRNPEMLKLVPNHLKTKKMRKHTVIKIPFIISMFPINIRLNKCVAKLFWKMVEL